MEASADRADETAVEPVGEAPPAQMSRPRPTRARRSRGPAWMSPSKPRASRRPKPMRGAASETAAPELPADAAASAAAAPAEPEIIEVWRPGGRRDEHAPPGTAPAAPRARAARAPAATPRPTRRRSRPRRRRHGGSCRRRRPPRTTAERAAPIAEAGAEAPRPSRSGPSPSGPIAVPDRGREQRGERPNDRSAPSGRHAAIARRGAIVRRAGDRPERDPDLRAKYIKGKGESRRDRAPDPNSPFAKLAALKEQLESNAKEPR